MRNLINLVVSCFRPTPTPAVAVPAKYRVKAQPVLQKDETGALTEAEREAITIAKVKGTKAFSVTGEIHLVQSGQTVSFHKAIASDSPLSLLNDFNAQVAQSGWVVRPSNITTRLLT